MQPDIIFEDDEFIEAVAMANDEFLMHYGIGPDDHPPGRGSGRYPKGTGDNPYQHDEGISAQVRKLREKGISERDIAEALGYKSTGELRSAISREKDIRMTEYSVAVPKYKADGLSDKAIAEKLGISESSVRNYLNADRKIQKDKTTRVAEALKEELKSKHYIDVGPGSELEAGCSRERMKTALEMLQDEGYHVYYIKQEQQGNPGKYTTIKVIGDPETDFKSVAQDHTLIKPFQTYVQNDGESVQGLLPVKSISSDRVKILYAEEGGVKKDGLIELRPGVEDISLGKSMYAQVRIGVDGDHYMKGMALYSKDIPEGYDVVYNSNKKLGTDKYDVFKEMKRNAKTGEVDQDNPFGASIKPLTAGGQSYCLDQNGNPTKELRVINKVNDQGDWQEWSKTISAQVLAKQPIPLVNRQLDLSYQDKLTEFNEIKALTNPTIKKKLLESFADDCDASAVHLKAKAFPGQAMHVIIPIISLKDDEIYAPNYEDGEKVALVRFPHAGTFEIPILKVNNKNKEALERMRNAPDAVGINSNVAERLSGADFDGDTVAVIPTKNTNIKSTPRLKELIGFDTKSYKFEDPEHAKIISSQGKQTEMGKVTNLIADMQIKGATTDEVARAVKHSMVVIDAEKHKLDYKKSEVDNRIQELKDKYQNGGGAATLITRSKSEKRVPETRYASIIDEDGKKHYAIDPSTGEYILEETGREYMRKSPTVKDPGRVVPGRAMVKTTRMADAKDARELLSDKTNPYPVEVVYADYANKLKTMAKEARKEAVNTPRLKRDPEAAKKYESEVDDLVSQLNIALKHAPKERQAQIISEANYKMKLEANPDIKGDKAQMKRLKGQCLDAARRRLGGKKPRVTISDREWEAIQKGAISDNRLRLILDNTDEDELRKRATPRNNKELNESMASLARTMAANGYTQKEIASRFDVSASTISKLING